MKLYPIRCAIVAALGGLLFGFDIVVISGATESLQRVFIDPTFADASETMQNFWKGFTVASALIGTIIGASVVSKPADAIGRRSTMFILALLFLVSAIGSALAWSWTSLVVFRLIGGLGIGGASVIAPMYIAEIAPASQRGRLVVLAQLNIVLGILLAFVSNLIIQQAGVSSAGAAGSPEYLQWMDSTGWRVMFGVESIPALAYFALLFSVPRSPRWLVAKNREDEARSVIAKLGTDAQNETVEQEINAIRESLRSERAALKAPLFTRRYFPLIMLAFAIAAFNQLSGINAILYYAPEVFKAAGFGDSAAFLNSVGIGLANLVFTIAAMTVIDKLGRRTLMLVGSIGYILSLSAVALAFYTQSSKDAEGVRTFTDPGSWVVLIGIIVFIASHAFGQGAVIWVFLSEIFPNAVRAKGQAFGSLTHWVFAAAISWTFPMIAQNSGGHVFAFYAVCMVAQLVWVLKIMPETKGVPLEEIEAKLGVAPQESSVHS